MARNVSNRMPTKLKPSGVKLEKKEGAWTTCGGVNDSLNINLRRDKPHPIHTLDQESQVIFSADLKPSNIHITTAVTSQLFSNPEEGSKTRAETSEEIKKT